MCVWRRKIALCAIVWLLPTVNEHVPLQITSLAKGLSELLTVVYFLPTVGDQIMCLLKISGIGHKRMLFLCCGWSCVPSNVLCDQMTSCILSKCGLFSTVDEHVRFQSASRPNNFLHSEQICIFSPLWVSLCWFRCPAEPNDFLHWTQLNIRSLLWVSIRLFRISGQPNDFWHPAQLCIFFLRWAVSLSFGVDL